MYHGTPTERAELRRTVMLPPDSKPKTTVSPKAGKKITKFTKLTKALTKRSQKPRNKGKQDGKSTAEEPEITTPLRRSRRIRKSTIVTESDDDTKEDEDEAYQPEKDDDELQIMDVDSSEEDTKSNSFPIVLTTYEMIIKDRVHLSRYDWGYIVVDEGHRLKNLDCKLMKEIKKYNSAGRMILTGTPLHV
jgi:ATP-dependent DNA helicase